MSDNGVAVVTGGSRGLGREISAGLQQRGWEVVVLDLSSEGESAYPFFEVDVTDRAAVDAVFDRVEREIGAVETLVNCAGIQSHMRLVADDATPWDKVMAVNLGGAFNSLRAAGRRMVPRGRGSVVNITSVSAERGGIARAPYSASKAALNSLTRTAAVEWAPSGVRVNAVGPGYTESPLLARAVESGAVSMEHLLDRIPMRELATPSDVADAVAFLASPEARYITGQILYVDGGFLADYGVR